MAEALTAGTQVAERYVIRAALNVTAHEGTYRASATWGDAVILTVFTPPHPDTPTGTRVRQAFVRYARSLAQAQHPGIPRVTDLVDTPYQVVVAQEDLLHRSLPDRLRQGPLAAEEAASLTRHLFRALAAAHSQALLHTQLKPEHLWFTQQGQPVLAGFGLGQRALREQGTPLAMDVRYAAPELLAGAAPTPQTDVYALGATLLQAVTGAAPPPTSARTQGVPLPPFAPGVPAAVRAALTEALKLTPAERAVSAAEVLEVMDHTAEPATPPAVEPELPRPPLRVAPKSREQPATPPPRISPPAPQRKLPLWPVLGFLGALALGGAMTASRLSGGNQAQGAETPSRSFAEEGSTSEAPSAVPETAEPVVLRTDVVTAWNLNLRSAASTTGAVITTAARADRLDVLAEQGAWIRVRTTAGQEGWVNGEHTLPLLSDSVAQALIEGVASGGDVTLHRGVYLLKEPLTLRTDVQLTGAGPGSTLLMGTAAEDTVRLENADVTLEALSILHAGTLPARVVLQEGGQLTANRVSFSGGVRNAEEDLYGSGLWVRNAGRTELRDVSLSGNAFGLYVSDTAHVEIQHSQLSGNSEGGALFEDEATGTLLDNTVTENGAHGIHIRGTAAPQVTDNRIQRNRGRGITIYEQARPNIETNTIQGNSLQGVGIQDEARPVLNRNTIRGNRQSGLTFFDRAAGTVSENAIQDNKKAGIAVTEEASPTLEQNTIGRNAENGISYADNAAGIARENLIEGNGNPGIAAWGYARPAITGNKVKGNKQSGIVIAENASAEVHANTVTGNALYGLIITGDAQPIIAENTVTENASGGILYKQNAGGSEYGNECYNNGGAELSVQLNPDQSGPEFSVDGCSLN